jgi:hypothetical protein
MAIVGHPRIAGGHDIPPTAEGHDVADPQENSLRSTGCWRATTSGLPWPAIRMTSSTIEK